MIKLVSNNNIYISLLIVVMILLVQIGSSVLFSFGTVGLLLLVFNVKTPYSPKVFSIIAIFIAYKIVSIGLFIIKYSSEEINLLREFRYLIVLLAFLYITQPKSYIKIKINITLIVCACSISIFVFVVLQACSSIIGLYIVTPDNYYAIDDGVLASKGLKHALENGYDFKSLFRPSAFFSEPSYLGMICSSLFFCCLHIDKTNKVIFICKILLVTSVILSTSVLGICGIVMLMIPLVNTKKRLFFSILISVASIILLFPLVDLLLGTRIEKILSLSDESTITRFIQPFEIILYNFSNGDILGIPQSSCIEHYRIAGFYGIDADPPFHNALLNIIINYGIIGLLMIYNLYKHVAQSITEKILILIFFCQNGDFFIYGKVFILLFFILIIRQNTKVEYLSRNLFGK